MSPTEEFGTRNDRPALFGVANESAGFSAKYYRSVP
jgi:hypothetical protein